MQYFRSWVKGGGVDVIENDLRLAAVTSQALESWFLWNIESLLFLQGAS